MAFNFQAKCMSACGMCVRVCSSMRLQQLCLLRCKRIKIMSFRYCMFACISLVNDPSTAVPRSVDAQVCRGGMWMKGIMCFNDTAC